MSNALETTICIYNILSGSSKENGYQAWFLGQKCEYDFIVIRWFVIFVSLFLYAIFKMACDEGYNTIMKPNLEASFSICNFEF